MRIKLKTKPFPAVRSNAKSWSPVVKKYHNKRNILNELIGEDKQLILETLIKGNFRIDFIFGLHKSISKKEKEKRMSGEKYHLQKPDLDNLLKAFKDTVFYKNELHNDCEVSHYKDIGKYWGEEDCIIFYIL